MKAIQHHVYGLTRTFVTLSKGKLLRFFIPGIVLGLLYYWIFSLPDDSPTHIQGWWNETKSFLERALREVGKFIIITILSPFNSFLSEKFDTELTGREFKTDLIQLLSDLLRAILVAILALLLELIFMGAWWLVSKMLNLSEINEIVYFLLGSFFYGFAFYDYSLERYGIGTMSSLKFAFSKPIHMILTGMFFALLMLLPIVGFILAPVLTTMLSTGVFIKLHELPSQSSGATLKN